MTWHDIEQATQALQQNYPQVASRIFRILLRDGELNAQQQAVAYMGLAKTVIDPAQQLAYLQRAASLDPQNEEINRALSDLMSRQLSDSQPVTTANRPVTKPLSDSTRGLPSFAPDPLNDTSLKLKPVDGRLPVPPIDVRTGAIFPNDPTPVPVSYPPNPLPHQRGTTNSLPYVVEHVQRSVGILGGKQSPGTGFFISSDGLIVTTHFVVGSAMRVEVALLDGQRLSGQVVRAFPDYDLALVRVHARVNSLPRFSNVAYLAENTPLLVASHQQDVLRTVCRPTRDAMSPKWFPTELNYLLDFGGAPIIDLNTQQVVGMMTRNAPRRDGFFVGLHMAVILQLAYRYVEQAQALVGHETYCPSCGAVSSASVYNAHYCPTCGAVYPYAQQRLRTPLNLSAFYDENAAPCSFCQSRVGTYQNRCLRCGKDLSSGGLKPPLMRR
ncbi:MAG: trypsin-like peptidase domain-containing protein [Anaerolineae bacterium]|nr:trypsin-like peptidase domain-containing protein [Anaerolineae bacterium]MDW8172817.1 trypsin-like peptidase domain-containing protein [Anaerolineae bacterium]